MQYMGKMKRAIAAGIAAAVVVSLLGATSGSAAKAPDRAVVISHQGDFDGTARARIEFNALYEDGTLTQVRHVRFGRVPVFCDGARDGYVYGFLRRTDVENGRFVKRGHFRSPWRQSRIRFVGRIDADGNGASGILAWSFERNGAACDTGRFHWQTQT